MSRSKCSLRDAEDAKMVKEFLTQRREVGKDYELANKRLKLLSLMYGSIPCSLLVEIRPTSRLCVISLAFSASSAPLRQNINERELHIELRERLGECLLQIVAQVLECL